MEFFGSNSVSTLNFAQACRSVIKSNSSFHRYFQVLMDNWAGNSSANINDKPAPVTRSSYQTNREIIQHRARELEHVLVSS